MLEWLKNPVPNSQIASVESLKCSTPDVTEKICNGMEENEQGLLNKCDFAEFPWTTYFLLRYLFFFYTPLTYLPCRCYYCPIESPSPDSPVPPAAEGDTRYTLPTNCSTPFVRLFHSHNFVHALTRSTLPRTL